MKTLPQRTGFEFRSKEEIGVDIRGLKQTSPKDFDEAFISFIIQNK
jgi:hypothetical protein